MKKFMKMFMSTTFIFLITMLMISPMTLADIAKSTKRAIKKVPSSAYSDEYVMYGENDRYELLVNEAQCLVSIYDNVKKENIPLIPEDSDSDPITSDANLNEIKSHLSIVYCEDDGVEKTMNSFTDSVSKGQYSIYELKNGVRIEYTMGTPPDERQLLPQQLTQEAFEKALSFYEKDSRKYKRLQYFYSYLTLDVAKNDSQRKELLNAYPILKKYNIYVLRSLSEKEKKEVAGYFKEIGYTFEMINDMYRLLEHEEKNVVKPYFTIPIDYILEDGCLAVEIAADEINYNFEDYYLETITLLKYFGAVKNQEGYLFVPDGSGSLIRFGKGIQYNKLYMTGLVYGDDISVQQTTESVCYRLPVYGIKGEKNAIFANITDGASYAKITAQTGNILDEYYTAYPTFTFHYKYVSVLTNYDTEQKNWPIYADKSNEGVYRVEYTLLHDGEATVEGMAGVYREYLFGDSHTGSANQDIPLYLSVLGSININKTFLGIPYSTHVPLSTFNDIKTMSTELMDHSVSNLSVQLLGWYNGGLNYTAPAKVSVQKDMGGAKGFEALYDMSRSSDALTLFPSFDLGFVMKTGWFDGLNYIKDAARTMEGKVSSKKPLSLSINKLKETGTTTILSTSAQRYSSVVSKFMSKYTDAGVSLMGIGSDAYGSYKKDNFVKREKTVQVYQDIFAQQAGEAGRPVMIEYGNAYALKYATDVLSLPYSDSNYPNFGERVAFVQMVLHGKVDYSTTAINLSADMHLQVLRCIETGAYPSFTVAYRNTIELRNDENYNRYYAVNYSTLFKKIVDCYAKINEVLRQVKDSEMLSHRNLAQNVYGTTYENGTIIVVNYSDTAYTDDRTDQTVEPKGYAVFQTKEGN